MNKNNLQILLDKLIKDAPGENKGAVSLQLQIGGQPYAGSVMHAKDHDGLYEMIVVDPQQKLAVSIFFMPGALQAVFVPKEQQMIKTGSGIIMPGAH